MQTFCHLWDITCAVPAARMLPLLPNYTWLTSPPLGHHLQEAFPEHSPFPVGSGSPHLPQLWNWSHCIMILSLCLSVSLTTQKFPWKKSPEFSLLVCSRCSQCIKWCKGLSGWKKKLNYKGFFSFIFKFYDCTNDICKFHGQGLNPSHNCDLWSWSKARTFNPQPWAKEWTHIFAAAQATAIGFLTYCHCATVWTPSSKLLFYLLI